MKRSLRASLVPTAPTTPLTWHSNQEARIKAEPGPRSAGVIFSQEPYLQNAGHRALSLHHKPPGRYWPSWLPRDRSNQAWARGTHSPGWFMQIGPWPIKTWPERQFPLTTQPQLWRTQSCQGVGKGAVASPDEDHAQNPTLGQSSHNSTPVKNPVALTSGQP